MLSPESFTKMSDRQAQLLQEKGSFLHQCSVVSSFSQQICSYAFFFKGRCMPAGENFRIKEQNDDFLAGMIRHRMLSGYLLLALLFVLSAS